MWMRSRLTPLALVALGLSVALACGDEQRAVAGDTYTVQGRVVKVLEPPVGPEVIIAHQAIPDFVGRSGEVVGMTPMTMGFPAGEDIDLAGLAPGTPVEFTFRVDWQGERPLALVEIRPLD